MYSPHTRRHVVFCAAQIGLRSQLTAAVYRKCLRLSAAARAGMPSGRVVNLMSADVAKSGCRGGRGDRGRGRRAVWHKAHGTRRTPLCRAWLSPEWCMRRARGAGGRGEGCRAVRCGTQHAAWPGVRRGVRHMTTNSQDTLSRLLWLEADSWGSWGSCQSGVCKGPRAGAWGAGGAGGAGGALSRLAHGTWQPTAQRHELHAAVRTDCVSPPTASCAPSPAVADFIYPQLTFMAAAPLAVCVSLVMLWFQIG